MTEHDPDGSICRNAGPHLHTSAYPVFLRPGQLVVVLDETPIAICFGELVANRVVSLLNEHGLLGVPAGMPVPPQQSPWPAPSGQPSSPPGVVDSQ